MIALERRLHETHRRLREMMSTPNRWCGAAATSASGNLGMGRPEGAAVSTATSRGTQSDAIRTERDDSAPQSRRH